MCNCPCCSWDGPYIPDRDEWIEDRVGRLHGLTDCKLLALLNVSDAEFNEYTPDEKSSIIICFAEEQWDLNFGDKAQALFAERWEEYEREWDLQESN